MGDIADRVGVMDAGQIVEEAPLDVLQRPFHPRPPAVRSYGPSAASKLRSCEI